MERVYREVWLRPFHKTHVAHATTYAAIDGEGRSVDVGPLLISSRANRPVGLPALLCRPDPASPRIEGEHVWAGALYTHFGHFVTETVPRLLAVRPLLDKRPEARLIGFRPPASFNLASPVVLWFLDRIGIDPARITGIETATRVERLVVPPPPFLAKYRYRPEVAGLIDAAAFGGGTATGERLFLSRRALPYQKIRVVNIAEIEDAYAEAGYRIVAPEVLPLDQQFDVICGAAEIAGENGSAMHWSLYSRHIRRVVTLGWPLGLQTGICRLRGQEQVVLRRPWLGALKGRRQHVPLDIVRAALRG